MGDAAFQKAQLAESTSVIAGAQASLKEDLGKFSQNVELYRTGVFSHTTKEAISTLGIGHKLDELENEFTEEDREHFTAEATTQLFPDVGLLLAKMDDKFTQIYEKASVLAESARGLRLDHVEGPARGIQEALHRDRASLANDLTQALHADVALFSSEINLRISKAIVDAKNDYDYRVEHFRAERRRSYLLFCGIAGVGWLGGLLAYRHHESAAPKSAVGEIVLSIVAALILQVGTVLVVGWWKSLPKLLFRTQEGIRSKLSSTIRDDVSKTLQEIVLGSLDEAIIANRLNKFYIETFSVDSDSWRSLAMSYFNALRELQAKFVRTRQEQLVHIEELRLGGLKYFTDPTRNLNILTGVALKIKERAIEPSFRLLNTTREQLLTVKNQVTTVLFD